MSLQCQYCFLKKTTFETLKNKRMKYLAILLFFIFASCHAKKDESNINIDASPVINQIPFVFKKAKVINTIIKPIEKQTLLILADSLFANEYESKMIDSLNINNGTLLVLYWEQKSDPVWIGAKIPGNYLYADLVGFNHGMIDVKRYDKQGRKTTIDEKEIKNTIQLIKTTPVAFMP